MVHSQLLNFDAAIADFDAGLKLSVDSISILSDRGLAFFNAQKYELATADFERVVQLDPKDSWAIDMLKKTKAAQAQTGATTKP